MISIPRYQFLFALTFHKLPLLTELEPPSFRCTICNLFDIIGKSFSWFSWEYVNVNPTHATGLIIIISISRFNNTIFFLTCNIFELWKLLLPSVINWQYDIVRYFARINPICSTPAAFIHHFLPINFNFTK